MRVFVLLQLAKQELEGANSVEGVEATLLRVSCLLFAMHAEGAPSVARPTC